MVGQSLQDEQRSENWGLNNSGTDQPLSGCWELIVNVKFQDLKPGQSHAYLLQFLSTRQRTPTLACDSFVIKAKQELALLVCPWDFVRGRLRWRSIPNASFSSTAQTSFQTWTQQALNHWEDDTETIQLELCSIQRASTACSTPWVVSWHINSHPNYSFQEIPNLHQHTDGPVQIM